MSGATLPTEARCRSCHRVERWDEHGATVVVAEGGSRRPSDPPARAAWAVLRAAAEGEVRVVGTCGACGQPLATSPESARPAIPFAVSLGDAELVLGTDGLVRVGGEVLHLDEAEGRVHRAWPAPRHDWIGDLAQTSAAAMMLVPFALWVAVVLFVVMFLADLGQPPLTITP